MLVLDRAAHEVLGHRRRGRRHVEGRVVVAGVAVGVEGAAVEVEVQLVGRRPSRCGRKGVVGRRGGRAEAVGGGRARAAHAGEAIVHVEAEVGLELHLGGLCVCVCM